MIHATFDVREHEEHGTLGLAMRGRGWADPHAGLAAAHDILEHGPNDSGTVEEELMALGASVFVRDGDNYYRMKRSGPAASAAYNLSAEFIQQEGYLRGSGITSLRDPGRTRAVEDHEEEIIQETARLGIRSVIEESDPDDGYHPVLSRFGEKPKIIGWMRKGYRAAARRLKTTPGWALESFNELERQLDEALSRSEEGQVIKVSVDPRRAIVEVRTDYA